MPEQYDKELFFKALQQQLPALKSQGQFNTFQAAFEAFRGVMNAIFADLPPDEKAAREALDMAFEAARTATRLTHQLTDVPEAASGKLAEDFKTPPAEFGEYDEQRKLLSELEGLTTLDHLNAWYKTNRKRIDEVVTASLRNPLLDAIRGKKNALTPPPEEKTP
jgi:hypothetical protein